ncbi:MAG: AAA family ATPase [Lachnospiraceae bacterium]|nr:AAA family ATPase [Lachnospiraceae bacterium]
MSSRLQFDHIMRIYDERRIVNRHTEESRYQEVCSAIPEYASLEDSFDISDDILSAIISGSKEALNRTISDISDTETKKKKLLTDNGFPADYLDHIYSCPDCKDTGYIDDHHCHCFQKELLNMLYNQTDLSLALLQDNFSNFNIEYYPDDYICSDNDTTPRDNIKRILNICRGFIDNFGKTADNLLIYGHSGVGKTFLSHCIAKEIIEKGYSVIYLTSYQLFDILETKFFHKEELDDMASGILSMLNTCDLLVIDDLGTEMINRFTEVQLFACIQERIKNNLSTIISTNLSFDDINRNYSERIFSRLTGHYKLLKITGHDIRIKKAVESA